MPIFVSRLLARFGMLTSWATPVVVILFVFATSWPLMVLAEPPGSGIVQPGNYWWYFVVTAATVGYGDFFPETAAGHVVGVYVIIGGIATLTTVFTKLASILEQARGRRMQGSATVKASGHVVLLGYTPGRTERIVRELLAENEVRIVLCATDTVPTHPMPDEAVEFARGNLTDADVLERAGVPTAARVLVDAADDNEALAIAVAIDHLNDDAHLVVTLRDMANVQLFAYVDERIRCVQWHTPRMITEELQSPGIAEVYAELMTYGGSNTYSVALPESVGPVTVERCRAVLGKQCAATLLAARADGQLLVNPAPAIQLDPPTTLYYISTRRVTAEEMRTALAAS